MYIVITLPQFFDGEAEAITAKFQCGLQRLHLRKPESSAEECRALLRAIPACYHPRITLHDHFELTEEFNLGGVHLNRRNPQVPEGWGGCVSVSCHSIDELAKRKSEGFLTFGGVAGGSFDYLTLSPIFDSISKQGYQAAFTPEQLIQAKTEGIIDNRVMALGGISSDNVDEALHYGFGGVLALGDAWQKSCLPIVLTIAGSDPSAGAGIQQDLKTITNCGCYGATVVTALTSQNTQGVQSSMSVPAEVVESQLRSLFADLNIAAVKTGMVPNREVAEVVVRVLKEEREKRLLPIVCDPILLSTSGHQLRDPDCVEFVVRELFPICTLVTPNLPELKYLQDNFSLFCSEGMHDSQAQDKKEILFSNANSHFSILRKGGHAEGDDMTDILYIPAEGLVQTFTSPRIPSTNLHGTGCTLSSAIASHLAHGKTLPQSVAEAKEYITQAIEGGRNLRIGHGNGPLYVQYK